MTDYRNFESFFLTATRTDDPPRSYQPYRYQSRLAAEGLPAALEVPTGAGKTAAVVLSWLWRLKYAPDETRRTVPRRLLYILPMRTLVEQTEANVQTWLSNLGLGDEVVLHVLMGGRLRSQNEWRKQMDRPAIIIATADCAISRLLMRGYGSSRGAYPIDFGLLHNGTQIVVDEVQLVQQATATCRQLSAFHSAFGTAERNALTCMSATVERAALDVVDNRWRVDDDVWSLTPAERADPLLSQRLQASKVVTRLTAVDTMKKLAAAVLERHKPGTLSLVVVNTVATAKGLYQDLGRLSDQQRLLLHSRFRPAERRKHVQRLLRAAADGDDLIVVSTQVVEAGVDLDARTLFTEAAPWPSICQRAGRLNRRGDHDDAKLYWFTPIKTTQPYETIDIAASESQLEQLEGIACKSADLAELRVPVTPVPLRFLRKADLVALFDTAPDVAGNDIDVSPYIRDGADRVNDVFISWIDADLLTAVSDGGAEWSPRNLPAGLPHEALRCPVSRTDLAELHKRIKEAARPIAWHFDPVENAWVRVWERTRIRPNDLVLMDRTAGGYRPDLGFDPMSTATVIDPQEEGLEPGAEVPTALPDGAEIDQERGSLNQPSWQTLNGHLRDAEGQAARLVEGLRKELVARDSKRLLATAVAATALHDLGKAHPDWQRALRDSAENPPSGDDTWAKSPLRPDGARPGRLRVLTGGKRPVRQSFRHELVSLLLLRGEAGRQLLTAREIPEAMHDLVRYLVAAHHGHVRVQPRDPVTDGRSGRSTLGVIDEEQLPRVEFEGISLGGGEVDLGLFAGGDDGWSAITERLMDEYGPFVLAYLETLVRIADWRASAAPTEGTYNAS